MAEHNFAAGIEMTMTNVVNNYLRWFRLNKAKRDIGSRSLLLSPATLRTDDAVSRPSPEWQRHPKVVARQHEELDSMGELAESGDSDPLTNL